MIIEQRVKEIFYFFPKIMPIHTEAQKRVIKKRLGVDLDTVATSLMLSLANDCIDPLNKEIAEGYFRWMSQAILYMMGESDEFPETQVEMGHEVKFATPPDQKEKNNFKIKSRK